MIVYLNKKQKIEKTSVIFVFFEKIFLSVKWKLVKKYDDDVLSRIKGIDEKIYHVENDQNKEKLFSKFFLTKNHNTCVSALLLTCKRNIRTEVSLHMSYIRVISQKVWPYLKLVPKFSTCMVSTSYRLKGARIAPHYCP